MQCPGFIRAPDLMPGSAGRVARGMCSLADTDVWYEHFYLSLQAASAGLGWAIASELMAYDELSDGRMAAPGASWPMARRTICFRLCRSSMTCAGWRCSTGSMPRQTHLHRPRQGGAVIAIRVRREVEEALRAPPSEVCR
jgi:hypothetical protein